MIKNYKIIEVFREDELGCNLEWNRFQKTQLLVVSLEDREDMYYAEEFLKVLYLSGEEGITSANINIG